MREAMLLTILLREHPLAVAHHIEHAAASLHQLDLRIREMCLDLRLHPGGLRKVVSNHAVFYRYFHLAPRSFAPIDAGQHGKERASLGTLFLCLLSVVSNGVKAPPNATRLLQLMLNFKEEVGRQKYEVSGSAGMEKHFIRIS